MSEQVIKTEEDYYEMLHEIDGLITGFLEGADADTFLTGIESHYQRLRPGTLTFSNEESMARAFVLHDWRGPEGTTPEEWGRSFWRHENAHRQSSLKFGVGSTVRMVLPVEGLFYAYAEFNVSDLRRVTGGDAIKVLNILGNVTMAPLLYPDASPHQEEINNGLLFLNVAHQWGHKE